MAALAPAMIRRIRARARQAALADGVDALEEGWRATLRGLLL
ncbi:MAG: hypothetical protein R3F60_20315 [bacterium]